MRPFLFLGTRAEDDVADQEYDAVLAGTGLRAEELVRVRVEAGPLPVVDLDAWSGIILGGGPFNVSDADDAKSPVQRRAEAELGDLAERVVAADFPFLGACYGIGVLGTLAGGVVDRTYTEPIGALPVTLTSEGRADPLFAAMPPVFHAYLGHKEAVSTLPEGAVLLASTDTCPVHAFRLGRNVYATQFHPELDAIAICDRIDAYSAHGYYEPHVSPDFIEVGDTGIKARRRRKTISGLGTAVGNCVPFYFAPRSPMLYRLWDRGRGVDQASIVYLTTTVEALVESGHEWVVSDRNAVLDLARFTTDAADLDDHIDWPLMRGAMWNDTPSEPDRKERRMAECLVLESVPWQRIMSVGCQNDAVAQRVRGILGAARHQPLVNVRAGWYF